MSALCHARQRFLVAIGLPFFLITVSIPIARSQQTPATAEQPPQLTHDGTAEIDFRWRTDLDEGKRVAAAGGRDLLIVFSGLPWHEPSKTFESGVLSNERLATLTTRYVLVRLDFPNDGATLPEEGSETKEPDKSWRGVYGIYSYPTVVLADAAGRPYALTMQSTASPTQFVRQIIQLSRNLHRRDAAFTKAEKSEGIAKAKNLAEALLTVQFATTRPTGSKIADPLLRFYCAEIDAILRLDADGKAGLKKRFEAILRGDDNRAKIEAIDRLITKTQREQGPDAALKLVDLQIAAAVSTDDSNHFRRKRLNYLELGKKYAEALDLSRELAADESFRDDERLQLRDHVALNLASLGRHDEALAYVDETLTAVADDPSDVVSVLHRKAYYLSLNNRDDEVVDAWEQILRLVDPGTEAAFDANFSYVLALAKLGRNDDARTAWEVFLTPKFFREAVAIDTLALLARSLELAGYHRAALEAAADVGKRLEKFRPTTDRDKLLCARAQKEAERIKSLPAKKPAGDAKDVPAI